MASIKEYNVKLASLRNTVKMTKTMKMVSASKLRKAQEAQREAQDYAHKLNHLIARLAAAVDTHAHPLLAPRDSVRKVLVLLITSDKGLCGGFNNNLIRAANRWLNATFTNGEEVTMSFCGRRGYQFFRSRRKVRHHYEGAQNNPTFEKAAPIGGDLMEHYLEGEYDAVYLVYNTFRSALSQVPTFQKLLPIESPEFAAMVGEVEPIPSADYIFQPSQKEMLAMLIPRTVNFKIFYAMLENAAGEHGARMTAMDNATSNADQMIETYTLLRNRARQAAITTELIEIISGAEAL